MLKYSLSPSPFPNSLPLHGASIPSGTKLYIYWDATGTTIKTPFTFMPSGQKENGAPYEYKGGQPVIFGDGTNSVRVSDSTGTVLEAAMFTVGTVTPPPPLEEIKEPMYIENGTHLLVETVSGKKYRTAVTKV